MNNVVGIDLGTTYSVISYVDAHGKPVVIPTESGRATTPSVVQFTVQGPIVGERAKEAQANGDQEVISFFKRSMGDPSFLLSFYGRDYTPTDLSALILCDLKGHAEAFLGTTITAAVITVPAYFTHAQRTATIEAGRQAGLNVLKIISEPTAAALAYGLRPTIQTQRVLVYDLGGGTFDVSLVEISPTELNVIATDGDHQLGGKDWDDRLISHLASQFEAEFGCEMSSEEMSDLYVQAEKLKHTLSTRQSASIRVQAAGQVGTYTVTREAFEEITHDLMERTQLLTERVLAAAHLSWSDLDGVLPVGGSTRMPIVRTFIERMSGKPPMSGINPDEAVALGAAIQAVMELEQKSEAAAPRLYLAGRKKTTDVIAHSLGMIAESSDRSRYRNSILIKKNLPIPIAQTRPYQLPIRRSGDSRLEVFLTQGEDEDPMHCQYLGCYVFSGFPQIQNRIAQLAITYEYDKNGVVHISAIEESTKQTLQLKIEPLPPDVPDRFALPPAQRQEAQPLTIYLAFDLSGSMSGHPLQEAKRAAREFVQQCDLATTSVGLISFSDRVSIDLKATQKEREIDRTIEDLTIGRTGIGNSAHPFEEISTLLRQQGGRRYAVVLADGVWSCQRDAVRVAKKCHTEQIEVIAIGFGHADKEFLSQIASTPEQSLFTDLNQLTETFSTIAQEISGASGGHPLRESVHFPFASGKKKRS